MAGIKLHGAIDVLIAKNCIHNAGRGLWMDWMAQGTRISSNLLYDNTTDDLFVEVNHGPFLVDNNVFLSPVSLLDMSEGGAYAHNLFSGSNGALPYRNESTPLQLNNVPRPEIEETGNEVHLRFPLDPAFAKAATQLVTSALLGTTVIAETGYTDSNGKPLVINKDYFGKPRDTGKPFPGPFASHVTDTKIRVW
jgi:hypothetical protein